MFNVVKHTRPAVWSSARLVLLTGLLSVLALAGSAQIFGIKTTAAAVTRGWHYLAARTTARPVSKSARALRAPQQETQQLKLVSTSAAPGSRVTVPVEFEASGNEHSLAFSLRFDPRALAQPEVTLTDETLGATLVVNADESNAGRLGVQVTLADGQALAPGLHKLVNVDFNVSSELSVAALPLEFGDQPVARFVADAQSQFISTGFINGLVAIQPGLEADVAPRPDGGNENLTVADWALLGRFAAGLDTAANGIEFQRADCAPRDTKGDGQITLNDWVQAGRYAAGLDAPSAAGGPTMPVSTASGLLSKNARLISAEQQQTRSVRIVPATFQRGQDGSTNVELTALGTEFAVGFTMNFDTTQLTFVRAVAGSDATGATVVVNANDALNGRVIINLSLPFGQKFAAGTRQLLTLTFNVPSTSTLNSTTVGFTNGGVVDDQAVTLAATFTAGVITLSPTITNQAPTLTSLNPAMLLVGTRNLTVTVNGANFVNGTTVRVNGADRFTEFVSATQLRVTLLSSDVVDTGTLSLTARTPDGVTTNALTLNINNPAPTLTSLTPSATATNTPGLTLTVNGSNFVPGAQISFNNVNRVTFFASDMQLTAQLPASAFTVAGTYNVLVTNPGPGGGPSNVLTFAVNAPKPIPRTTSISPTTTQAGGAAFTLTVTGSGYVNESVVRWNGDARATTFVSNTQLTAQITANDIANAGTASVTVFNSPPGGGVSSAQLFTISQAPNPVPAITALNPASVTAGGAAFTLTVNGTGFVQTSSVRINGQDRQTTYVSSTELRAAITAADIANGGTAEIRVNNPPSSGGGGGLSQGSPLTINFAPPTITLVSPSSAVAGGPAFTMSVIGTNFGANSVLRWNGDARPTTVVSVTELTAQITAADIANVGTAKLTVFSPAANAASNEVTFNITQATRPIPRITALTPNTATAGGAAFTLTVTGVNFVSDSVVRWNGQARPTTFTNSTQVTAQIAAADIANLGTARVSVFTPPAGGGESNDLTFSITQAPNPVPAITSLNPPNATAGANGLALTINGSGFVATSVVRLNGNGETRPSTFVNANQLTVQLTANDLASAGTLTLTVFNPAPGGGTSNNVTLNIINAVPTLTSLNPTLVGEGTTNQLLTVTGTGFVRGSQIVVNGNARGTTYVSATSLTTVLTANDAATAPATLQIQVSNPTPGGGLSNVLPLEVRKRNSLPRITTLNPTSATAGSPGFTLLVTGTGFVQGSIVRWNGQDRPTDFSSETLIVAQIAASDIAAGGTAQISVFNPAPGGGSSGTVAFNITNPTPRITSITPDNAVAGSGAVTLVINGSGFVANSQARFGGNDVPTTFVTNSQLSAQVPAAAVATGGAYPVTVVNPAPGGGASNAATFTVTNPAPTLAQLVPNNAAAGSPGFILTLIGTGFTPASVVRWNGQDRLTTFIGQTQLTAVVNAADVAQVTTAQVTVFTPAPGGGTSAALAFTVKDEPNPVPGLISLNPNQAFAGGVAFTLTITGNGFVAGSRVNWNGETRLTTYISTTQIAAQIAAADIANAATANVTIVNPAPGGGVSNTLTFNIIPPPNPVPVINNISPNASFAGAAGLSLTVNGTGFINDSVVRWNGEPRVTARVSATQLTAQIPASDLAQGGTAQVTVFTPPSVSGGGGTSNAAAFSIRQLPPAQITLTPNAPASNDTITAQLSGNWGDGCIPLNPQVTFVGNEVRISTSNPGQVCTAAITPWNLSATFGPLTTGNYFLRVFYTSSIGTAEIGQANFSVVNGRPTLTSLAPNQAPAGSGGVLLTVNGSGFFPGALVQVNGAARETVFINATQLTAALTEADLLLGSVLTITVLNPAPGGGVSNALPFNVNNPAPQLSAINPAAVQAGSGAFTLTVNGNGFVPGAVVRWNGADRLTTFISNTTLTAAIPASDTSNTGTATITVFNPAPGGGSSSGVPLTIDNAPPCQTVCFQAPQYYVLNMSRLPSGSIFIAGTGFNQPVSIQDNLADVKRALQGGRSALAQLNSEYVAAQISLLAAAGPFGSPAVLAGQLRCYGLNFTALTLSNGFTVNTLTTIGDLLNQARLALVENRNDDMSALAVVLDLLNGNEPGSRCGGFNAGSVASNGN